MSLRRIEMLLRDARYSSNVQDVDTITDEVMIHYSNRVQSMIEDLIFKINSTNNIFMATQEITMVAGTTLYPLNYDIYGVSAIKSVGIKRTTSAGYIVDPLRYLSEKFSGSSFGYSIQEGNINLNFISASGYPIVVNYVRKIPTLGKRFGKVSAIGSGTATVPATASTELLDTYDDFFTAVDVDGIVVARNCRITSYVYSTGVITYTGGTGTVAVGNYIIPGKYSTSHSQLPQECEKVFLEVLERRIAQRQSATDMNVISPLTDREIKSVEDVFAKGSDDDAIPPTPMYSEFSEYM